MGLRVRPSLRCLRFESSSNPIESSRIAFDESSDSVLYYIVGYLERRGGTGSDWVSGDIAAV